VTGAPVPWPWGQAVAVRRATTDDVAAIRTIATDAWRDTYRGLLRDETIEWFVGRAYTDERVTLRVERHETWVATLHGVVAAFAETAIAPDRVTLVAIYADPARRRRGLGTALLEGIVAVHPDLPIAADVLMGNRLGEAWYEARGFAPREVVEEELGGELVVERRWWRPADR
jgi:ribosomal protein S18 acetylase RimI-like enzyme